MILPALRRALPPAFLATPPPLRASPLRASPLRACLSRSAPRAMSDSASVTGNRATSGARFDSPLPRGAHALQLYSLGTPNGQKVAIALEELGLAYDAWKVDIMEGGQFGSEFVALNPNEKIPVLLDRDGPDGEEFSVFESGAILMYLAEKAGRLYPARGEARSRVTQWVMWQMGSGPYLGQYGHFAVYAKEKIPYAIERYAMEAKRICSVLDAQLARTGAFVCGEYSIADIAIFPWIVCLDKFYGGKEALGLESYEHIQRWIAEMSQRDAVKLGMQINGFGESEYANYSSDGKKKSG